MIEQLANPFLLPSYTCLPLQDWPNARLITYFAHDQFQTITLAVVQKRAKLISC